MVVLKVLFRIKFPNWIRMPTISNISHWYFINKICNLRLDPFCIFVARHAMSSTPSRNIDTILTPRSLHTRPFSRWITSLCQAQRISHISSGDSSAFSPCRGIFPGYRYIGNYMNHFPLYFQKGCSRYRHIFVTRVSEVIMFSPCVLVCFFVSLSRCLSGRFNYEGLVAHKQYFAGTLLVMSSCASYASHTHDVIDDVTRS